MAERGRDGGGDGRARGAGFADSSSLSALLLVAFAFAGGVYLLLIDTTSLPELFTGAVITLLALLAVMAARAQGLAEASFAPRWMLRAWRPFVRIPLDVAILSLASLSQLVRPSSRRGRFVAIPFATAVHDTRAGDRGGARRDRDRGRARGDGGRGNGGEGGGSGGGDGADRKAHEPARARNIGQRALAEVLGCVSPNTIVLGVDTTRRLIIAHQLRPRVDSRTIDPMDLG